MHERLSDAFSLLGRNFLIRSPLMALPDTHGRSGAIVGYRIDHLGRPKGPMRTTCDALLSKLQLDAPQANLGFLWHALC